MHRVHEKRNLQSRRNHLKAKNTKNKREAATSCAYDIKKREEKAFVCKIDSESRIEDSSEVKSEWRVKLAE